MRTHGRPRLRACGGWLGCVGVALCLMVAGCHAAPHHKDGVADIVPRELSKVPLPHYVIEPPDILIIDTLRAVPKPPYLIQPLDAIAIQASEVIKTEPIVGIYTVDPDGTVNLGPKYGTVKVAGLSIEKAREAIINYLRESGFKTADATVAIAQSRAMQVIRGEHLVRPDGTVGLGVYGSVPVVGLTLEEARQTIEAYLSQFLEAPEVSVDVYAYNSKFYYVVTDGGGYGEGVYSFASTGNETVLDAMAKINGLPIVACKHRIWVARPDAACPGGCRTLPVDWNAVVRCGDPRTNYQVLPNDRIYVQAEPVITLDTALARMISPIERILGVTLLGSSAVHSVAVPLGTPSGF